MKDTCKQAIFRKDNKRAKRVIDIWREEIKIKGELEFFNIRYDILAQVMSMPSSRLAPKIGHLERIKCYMDILQRPNTLLSGIEPKNLIILTDQNKNMNGPGLSMEILKKRSQRIYRNYRKKCNNHHIFRCQPSP